MEWIQRATQVAESVLTSSGGESWVVAQRRRKWRWAGRVAKMSDGRWTHETLLWEPTNGQRSVGRPALRWSDAFVSYFATIDGLDAEWYLLAQDAASWNEHEDYFCNQL